METEKKYALLIDADNVSPKYMDLVLRETKTLGDVSIRRIYGDWTEIGKHSWKECLLENSLTPIQQYSYTTGKNASDSAMIIDAMDILYTREIDGFVIVSSDSDFTKLAMRLRESGKYVVGMGESKTPSPFVKACDRFKTLDILMRSVEEMLEKVIINVRTITLRSRVQRKKKMRQIFLRSLILERSKRQFFRC